MFVVNNPNRSVAPLQSTSQTTSAREVESPPSPSTPAPLFSQSAFETQGANRVALGGPQPGAYFPTNAELQRPTTASVVNITNGERQPLNPVQMSSEQGVNFVQQRLAALGFTGSLTAANTTSPTTGPFRIDYGNDDRRHWDIGGMNIGLIQNLYANNPPEVADAMLRADMQYARSGPASWEEESTPRIPPGLLASNAPSPLRAQSELPQPFRVLPGTSGAPRPTPPTGSSGTTAWQPTRDEIFRPTTASSVNITNGERVALNPGQMSSQQAVDFMRQRLQALGYGGPGNVSNQTAPTSGPFGIDYGTDDRRHWDIDGMNVGLTMQLYANNPREVADRMLQDMLRQVNTGNRD